MEQICQIWRNASMLACVNSQVHTTHSITKSCLNIKSFQFFAETKMATFKLQFSLFTWKVCDSRVMRFLRKLLKLSGFSYQNKPRVKFLALEHNLWLLEMVKNVKRKYVSSYCFRDFYKTDWVITEKGLQQSCRTRALSYGKLFLIFYQLRACKTSKICVEKGFLVIFPIFRVTGKR